MASNSPIRFSGMASGMDTESLVKAMVSRYQEKVDDKKKSQTLLEWKKDAYKETSLKVNTFYTDVARKLRLDSSFTTKALKSTDPSKVDVKSTGSATEGKHTIDYVKQVGESAVINTSTIGRVVTGKIDPSNKDNVEASATLSSIGINEDLKIKVSDGLHSQEITLYSTDTMRDVARKINELNDGSDNAVDINAYLYNGKFDISSGSMWKNAQNISITTTDSSKSSQLEKLGLATSKITKTTKLSELGIDSKHTLKVGDGTSSSEIIIDKDMTIGELAAEISQELANGTATFDETAGAFFISSKGTGANQIINLEVTEGNLGNALLDELGIGRSVSMTSEDMNVWKQVYQIDVSTTNENATLGEAFGITPPSVLTLDIGADTVTLEATKTLKDLENVIKEKSHAISSGLKIQDGKLNILLNKLGERDAGGNMHMPTTNISINGSSVTQTVNSKSFLVFGASGTVNKETKLGTQDGDKLRLQYGSDSPIEVDLSSTSTVDTLLASIKEKLGISDDDISFENGELQIKGLTDNLEMEIVKNVNNYSAQGKSAIFSYNGIEMQSESNTVSVNGMELTINSTTNDPVYINVTNDTEAAYKFITGFVDAYNELIKFGNEKVHATSYGKLEPLTSEEKEAMADSDVQAWEKKIKDGLLRNDSTLSELLSDMRTILSSVVEDGDFKSLASIGITTSSTLADRGKLILDEDKLKKALAENPDDVTSLFTGSGRSAKRAYLEANKDKTAADYEALDDEEKDKWKAKVKGIGEKMYDLLSSKFTYVANTKTSSSIFSDTALDKDITNTKSEYDRLVDILNAKEDYYYKLFANMETTMNKLNNQQNYIAQMFAAK